MEKPEQSCQKQISDGKKTKMASNSIDRLSALPDCVLTHILSFLSTKLSVSTSILGRRWRSLWSQVPILEFNSFDYRNSATALSKIINKITMLHKVTNLDTFRLVVPGDACKGFEFEAWIGTIYDRNVRNLDIFLPNKMNLPQCLFNCKTLVDLTLVGWCVHMYIPMSGPVVCLPALKKLHLSGVTIESDSLPHLISSCPVLEELFVKAVASKSRVVVICHIPSPTLNNLVLFSNWCVVFEVKLDTPALRYLKLWGNTSDVSAGALTSLIEADINFESLEEITDDALFPHHVIEFVGKLYNVKSLKLWGPQLEVHSSAFSAVTIKFYNLTELILSADSRFILWFLENADNLQVLKIYEFHGDLNWTDPKQVPACLASHLQKVRIQSVKGQEQEFSMMRYILRNAKVLEKMKICSSKKIDKLETLQRISTFQRGSETCQVVFT